MNKRSFVTDYCFSFEQGDPVLRRRNKNIEDVENFIDILLSHKNNVDSLNKYFYDLFILDNIDRPTYVICRWGNTESIDDYKITVVQIVDNIIICGDNNKFYCDTQIDLDAYVKNIILGE